MPREIISQAGTIVYRTKLFTVRASASAFAKCIRANDSRFRGVDVVESTKSKTPKWFVTFQPASADRRADMLDTQIDARQQRAETEGFIFWADPDTTYLTWCFSLGSGEVYELARRECSCPDYQFRCRNAGIQCKHQIAFRLEQTSIQQAA